MGLRENKLWLCRSQQNLPEKHRERKHSWLNQGLWRASRLRERGKWQKGHGVDRGGRGGIKETGVVLRVWGEKRQWSWKKLSYVVIRSHMFILQATGHNVLQK